MKVRDYRDYIHDILDAINDIENFLVGLSFDEFTKDRKTFNAVVRSIEIIGEASKNIPETIKAKYRVALETNGWNERQTDSCLLWS